MIPPYEVKVTNIAVREFFDQGDYSTLLGSMNAFRAIEKQVLLAISNAKDTVYSMRVEKMHPEQIALTCIANTLEMHIGSGHYHIYRGMLTPVGNDLRHALNQANELMSEKGYISQNEINRLNNELNKQIQRAG